MKTIQDAYTEELLSIYRKSGDWEVLRTINNLLADLLRCIDEEPTRLDTVKRHIHKQLLTPPRDIR